MGSRIRDKVPHLFELFCEVAPGDHVQEPYIINKYPEVYNSDELKVIPKFTFPCKLDNSRVQHYSFVLTTADSEFTFGFCRYDNRANTSLVLLSFLPWHDIFNKLLNCIANLLNSPKRNELKMFLEACRKRPMPGHTLEVTYNAGQSVFSCQNPGQKLPSIPENGNLTEYYSVVDAKCMAGLWAALLYERRIAIIATEPFRLSACVQAANGTLFPMSWQHIFIPILPKHVVEYLSAPMPYLIGVPRSVMETVNTAELGDIVILDIDYKKLKTKHDDLESLPHDLVSNLKKALERKNVLSSDAVSRAFLVALVSLIGGYRDSFKVEEGQHFTFDDERFVNSRKNMQPFLREILQTQIFRQFIERRLELLNSGKPSTDEFDVECNKYSNRLNTGRSQKLKDQYQDFANNVKKEGGAFFKTVKNKANPAVQSVSKTVRRGGNNVKTAVKGLKNKLPKTGSRASSLNTHDDSRISCGSVTPVSSSSSGSSSPPTPAPRPPRLDIDLLGDMNLYLDRSRRASLPDSSPDNVHLTAADKAKTLSPCLPPPVPDRPLPSFAPSYLVVPTTRNLLDLTDAPAPPPRTNAALGHRSGYTTNIIKDVNGETEERTNTISFAKFGKDRTLKLTISSNESRLVNAPTFPPPPPPVAPPPVANGGTPLRVPPPAPVASSLPSAALYVPSHGKPRRQNAVKFQQTVTQETFGSDTDLIQLDDSPELEDFDPLKRIDKSDKVHEIKSSTDSALLHEYGLDFSQFGLLDYSGETSTSNVPKGWTTFN